MKAPYEKLAEQFPWLPLPPKPPEVPHVDPPQIGHLATQEEAQLSAGSTGLFQQLLCGYPQRLYVFAQEHPGALPETTVRLLVDLQVHDRAPTEEELVELDKATALFVTYKPPKPQVTQKIKAPPKEVPKGTTYEELDPYWWT